jgi:molybdopterin synthase sulfur carrier subunit
MRGLTHGQERVQVAGATVRQVIASLEETYPGIRARLMDDDRIHPSIAVFVDGEAAQMGLLEPVSEESEVHFLPAIGGGREPEEENCFS